MIIFSFQSKTGSERPRKSENKNYRSDQFPTRPLLKNSKKIAKKFKKIKNTIMASFHAKTRWEMPGNSENKNYRSNQFQLDQV